MDFQDVVDEEGLEGEGNDEDDEDEEDDVENMELDEEEEDEEEEDAGEEDAVAADAAAAEDEEDEEIDEDEEDEIIGDEEDEIIGDEEDEEDEEEDDEDEEDEEEEEAASEYFDAYNDMLDFINEDAGRGVDAGDTNDDDDFLTHFETLWHGGNHHGGNGHGLGPIRTDGAHHIVLGHQLGLGNAGGHHHAGRNHYQINILGGGSGLAGLSGLGGLSGLSGLEGIGSGVGAGSSLPPHPLSVSAVHPLLVHQRHGSEVSGSGVSGGAQVSVGVIGSASNPFQITGQTLTTGGGVVSGGAGIISPILRTMRNLHAQIQQVEKFSLLN